ncbi:transglutaminase-like domain-containing protein [Shouchella lonarensis]|uniref:Transglutaminase-like superfamily protein n=1 Tax=Shouchella lonarensis TaxID=1464122 RepID=A0A1G6IMY4_9BACI|nr:transglutaminase-like domain-containing protein [Shouchella lonarensis]SDC07781.1 Transglutaminase-like superfamily protein [Shouchella lonarensis]
MKTFTYKFVFQNRRSHQMKLWLSDLPIHPHQTTNVCLENRKADEIVPVDIAGNRLSYYALAPGETIEKVYEITVKTRDEGHDIPTLSTEERNYYLRSSTFIQINEEICQLAKEVCAELIADEEKARALFDYVRLSFHYKHPPKERGNLAFLRLKQGDCGEFSFLYASLCRAVNIPCRVVFGAWAVGKGLHAHAWNEVYLEESGWVPVDLSMANLSKREWWNKFLSPWPFLKPKAYFGRIEEQRIIFSIETEHDPMGRYPDSEERNSVTFPVNNCPLSWGRGLLNGKIPYLQPVYFYEEEPLKMPLGKDYVGSWTIYEQGKQKGLQFIKNVARKCFLIAAVLVAITYILSWITPLQTYTSLPFSVCLLAASVFSVAAIMRRENRVLYVGVLSICLLFLLLPVL